MKYKTKDLLAIHAALSLAANMPHLEKGLNYCVAKNLVRLRKMQEEFTEENTLRIHAYAEKDPETGEPKLVDGKYDFGRYTKEANDKYKELLDKEYDFEPYTIPRSDATDALPAVVLQELLEVIILD